MPTAMTRTHPWKAKKRRKEETSEVTEEELGACFYLCRRVGAQCANARCRGVQDEPEDDGGPDGELCRRGTLSSCSSCGLWIVRSIISLSLVWFIALLVDTCVVLSNAHHCF